MNKEVILKFIEENIREHSEIHVSYEFSKFIEQFEEFTSIEKFFEQDIVGDYKFGDIKVGEKTYPIFSNILFEFDEIEFKN